MNKETNYIKGKQYKVDTDQIKTIQDIQNIFKFLDLHFTPQSEEQYESIKHLLKEVTY